MKFKRLVDNKPAYTAGKVYNVIQDKSDLSCLIIENDMGSHWYYNLNDYQDIQEFKRMWKEVK